MFKQKEKKNNSVSPAEESRVNSIKELLNVKHINALLLAYTECLSFIAHLLIQRNFKDEFIYSGEENERALQEATMLYGKIRGKNKSMNPGYKMFEYPELKECPEELYEIIKGEVAYQKEENKNPMESFLNSQVGEVEDLSDADLMRNVIECSKAIILLMSIRGAEKRARVDGEYRYTCMCFFAYVERVTKEAMNRRIITPFCSPLYNTLIAF